MPYSTQEVGDLRSQILSGLRIAVVAAHPDDETIGLGGVLPLIAPSCSMVHLTNGAPRDMRDAARLGFDSAAAYASARRTELARGLKLCGIGPERCYSLDFTDQETWRDLEAVTSAMADMLARLRPEVVITHPYEGGHPDHDSTAFAVQQATQRLSCQVFEFTSYHAGPGGDMETSEFLPGEEQVWSIALDANERSRKKAMFDCFVTQREVLACFPIAVEKLRRAPRYDFAEPPHPGPLFYERFDWGVTGELWRRQAADVLATGPAARLP